MEPGKSLRASLFLPFKRLFGAGRLTGRLAEKIHLVFLDGAMVQSSLALLRLARTERQRTGNTIADYLIMLDEDAAGVLLRHADNHALRHKVRYMIVNRAAWFASRAIILPPQELTCIDDALADFLVQRSDALHACLFASTARGILRRRH